MKHSFSHIIYIYKVSLALLVGVLTFAACGSEDEPQPNPEPETEAAGRPGVAMARTLIVYIVGENSLARFVAADSIEIAQGLQGIADNSRVVVYIDDAKSSRICVGTRTTPFQTVKTFTSNVKSTDSEGMYSVLNEIFTTYPAEHYGLSFWSHASGWVEHPGSSQVKRRSFGIDNGRRDSYSNDGSEMSITTMAKVLARLPHTDFIIFDACFMQCVEVAYELRNVTDYVIGSPAEIPADGAPYHLALASLCTPQADITGFIDTYYNYYITGDGHSTYQGVVLSAVRTNKLEALAQATRPIVAELYGGRSEANLDGVQRYCPRDGSDYYTEYYDMVSLMYHNLSPQAFAAWRAVYDEAVPQVRLSEWYTALQTPHILNVSDKEHTGAVSMFTPGVRYDDSRNWNEEYHSTAWYHAAGFDTTDW